MEDHSGCVTLLNERTGQWHLLNSTAAYTWRMAHAEATVGDVLTALATRFPHTSEERIRDDFERLLDDLSHRGLIGIRTVDAADDGWSETTMVLESQSSSSFNARQLVTAALAIPLAIILTRIPFRYTALLVRSAKRRLNYPAATAEEADALAAAAHRVTRHHPGRMACYELSLTVLVASLLSHRSVDLHLGTATDPRRFHAWIETRGHIVSADPHPCLGNGYQRIIQI